MHILTILVVNLLIASELVVSIVVEQLVDDQKLETDSYVAEETNFTNWTNAAIHQILAPNGNHVLGMDWCSKNGTFSKCCIFDDIASWQTYPEDRFQSEGLSSYRLKQYLDPPGSAVKYKKNPFLTYQDVASAKGLSKWSDICNGMNPCCDKKNWDYDNLAKALNCEDVQFPLWSRWKRDMTLSIAYSPREIRHALMKNKEGLPRCVL